MHKVRTRNHQFRYFPHLCFVVRCEDGLVYSKFQLTVSFSITSLGYCLQIGSFFNMSRRCSHLLKLLHMLPRWCSTGQKSPRSLCMMVLFDGSPSRSTNRNAVVELKLISSAINQSTPTIEYIHSLIVSRHLVFSSHRLQTLLSEVSASRDFVCKLARETVMVLTTSWNFYQDVAPPCLYWSSSQIWSCLRSFPALD